MYLCCQITCFSFQNTDFDSQYDLVNLKLIQSVPDNSCKPMVSQKAPRTCSLMIKVESYQRPPCFCQQCWQCVDKLSSDCSFVVSKRSNQLTEPQIFKSSNLPKKAGKFFQDYVTTLQIKQNQNIICPPSALFSTH